MQCTEQALRASRVLVIDWHLSCVFWWSRGLERRLWGEDGTGIGKASWLRGGRGGEMGRGRCPLGGWAQERKLDNLPERQLLVPVTL